jgi:hypothetical protein
LEKLQILSGKRGGEFEIILVMVIDLKTCRKLGEGVYAVVYESCSSVTL